MDFNRNMNRRKNWEKIKEKLPKGYRWKGARRKNKKGRAMRGMIVGVKKKLIEKEQEIEQEKEEDMKEKRIIEGRIKYGKGTE